METLYPIAGFITVATITPGPNNFIVLSAAARRGFRAATLPIAGILSGGLAVLVLCWAGVGTVLHAVPWFRPALVGTGAIYLAWLGLVMILRAGKGGQESGSSPAGLPGTFLGVAAFQVANPKGWVLLLTATAAMQEGGSGPARLALLAGDVHGHLRGQFRPVGRSRRPARPQAPASFHAGLVRSPHGGTAHRLRGPATGVSARDRARPQSSRSADRDPHPLHEPTPAAVRPATPPR